MMRFKPVGHFFFLWSTFIKFMIEVEEDLLTDMIGGIFEISKRLDTLLLD